MIAKESVSGTNEVPLCKGEGRNEPGADLASHRLFVATHPLVSGTAAPTPLFPSSMAQFLATNLLPFLPDSRSIRGTYWSYEESTVRIWTIIDEPDDALEQAIHKAQMSFIDSHPNLTWDFCVIYRFNKPIETIIPTDAIKVEGA